MKVCITCKERLPKSEFHLCRRQGHQSRCKSCRKRWSAEKYKADPELRERRRNGHYISRYGMTYDEVLALRERQDCKCAICREELAGGRQEHVDHCHESGVVRGILCSECNTGIGKLQDSPALLRVAADYLEKPHDIDVSAWLAAGMPV